MTKAAAALLVLIHRMSDRGAAPVAGEEAKRLFGEGFNGALIELLRADCILQVGPRTIALSAAGHEKAMSLRSRA